MNFEILANGKVIGHSTLEHGDPPMGVAFGPLSITEAYLAFAPLFVAAAGRTPDGVRLSVRVMGSTEELDCVGVGVSDFTQALPNEPIQVEVLGISYPAYQELFPEHVALYNRAFSASSGA